MTKKYIPTWARDRVDVHESFAFRLALVVGGLLLGIRILAVLVAAAVGVSVPF